MKKTHQVLTRLCVLACLSLAPASAMAQVTITSPASGQRLPAGPDFATNQFSDPWDMNNIEDLSPEPFEQQGWSGLTMSGGLLTGTTVPVNGAVDSAVTFFYRGFYGIINANRNGLRYPIDPNFYRKLSFKMSSSAAGENVYAYWFHRPLGDPGGQGLGNRFLGNTTGANQIFVNDLGVAGATGEAWNAAVVRGLRIDPNSAQTGAQVSFDWVRLTPADGAPGAAMHTITWSGGSGTSIIDVTDAAGTVMTIATGVTATSFAWNYGVLPPGAYTLRVRRGSATATQAFSINNPPILKVTDPDESGGADFATDVLRNPWDMAGAPDVLATSNVTSPSYSNGFFHGNSNTTGDPSVFLFGQGNNGTPIDSKRYRYLSFDLAVDGDYDLARGSVARVLWGSGPNNDGSLMTTTKDIIVWPGINHYTIDLGSLTTSATGGLTMDGVAQPWMTAATKHFRIDPHEFPEVRGFHLGPVRIAAMDEAAPSFTIRWTGADADGDATNVALYYDTNTNPGDGMTLIASGISMATGAYQWNAGAVPVGAYYIYALANDGIQTFGSYSTGAVAVNGGTSPGNVLMSIDSPANNATVPGPFAVAGWAIDRGAATGSGIDAVHVYAYPNPGSGQAAIFLGAATYGSARSDVGGAYGSQFTNSGYGLSSAGLAAGNYQIVAYAHSTVTGTFARSASILLQSTGPTPAPRMSIDQPRNGAAVAQPFIVGGWAIDAGARSGSGVDVVHVYAYPNPGSGAAPIFLGVSPYGSARSDVGSAFGSQFASSGYNLDVRSLAAGLYQIVVYARSTVTGTFNNSASVSIRVLNPVMSIDSPGSSASVARTFAVAGWAIDLGAPSGTGVDAVHVWAYPTTGAAAVFAGAATYGASRTDVGAAYGNRFTNSGYNLTVSSLGAGTYDLVVYAHSPLSNTFVTSRVVRVTVR
jgi:hypothetical protein